MKQIDLHISPLHAETLATHLLLVLKHYVTGKPADSIPESVMKLLEQIDIAYQKLNALTSASDDETPRPVALSIPEAEAFLKAFTEPEFRDAALVDDYYQQHSYSAYFGQIYARYLKEVRDGYFEALAA